MTEAEKNEIVGLVMTEISSQAVDFDINTEQPQANDLLTAVRQTSPGAYVGVTIKWDDVARIATELANQAAKRAEQAETDANNILTQVQSKGTEITNFVATSKAELETQKNESVNAVKSVYQTDLNELKGDLDNVIPTSPNLFNKDSDDILNGYFSNNSFISNELYRLTHPIYVKGGVEYKYKLAPSLGSNKDIPVLNESMQIYTQIVGSIVDGYVKFTPHSDLCIRVNIGKYVDMPTFMVCETSKYPNEYMSYGNYINSDFLTKSETESIKRATFNTNVLRNKSVVFDGDSICEGSGDTSLGLGWASRIGNKNNMDWHNVGISGGTISVVDGRHNLCTYIDTIHNDYPNLDYLILEGGTNDADVIGINNIGEIAVIDKEWTTFPDFRGNYDTSTFCGALETLFYKAINYYPNAKIGYIVAPKMAVWSESDNAFLLPYHRREFFAKAKEICKKWGIPYCDLWNDSPMNPCVSAYYDRTQTSDWNKANKYYVDGQHPTPIGYEYITPYIESWMKTL